MGYVSVIGNAVVDMYLFDVASWPTADGERALVGGDIRYFSGGTGLNVAKLLSYLGHDVHFFTAIGSGGNASLIQRDLGPTEDPQGKIAGTITMHAANCPEDVHTSVSVVRPTKSANAQFVHYPGASKFLTEQFLTTEANLNVIAQSDAVYFGGLELTGIGKTIGNVLPLLRPLAKKSLPIFADVTLQSEGQESARSEQPDPSDYVHTFLQNVDFFFPNESEALQYSGQTWSKELDKQEDAAEEITHLSKLKEAARKFNQNVRKATVITRGRKGVICYEKGKQPAPVPAMASSDFDDPVDTVGAGDAFVAGFLSAILNQPRLGKSHDLRHACEIGCAVAARVVEKYGAWTPISNFDYMAEWVELNRANKSRTA